MCTGMTTLTSTVSPLFPATDIATTVVTSESRCAAIRFQYVTNARRRGGRSAVFVGIQFSTQAIRCIPRIGRAHGCNQHIQQGPNEFQWKIFDPPEEENSPPGAGTYSAGP
ncbi:hypothetical protein GCM10010176_091970 [Nonomuraea spiralis]|nr:hypothetical protein GCM10010176_091970 [Nonomuraea spiralis]